MTDEKDGSGDDAGKLAQEYLDLWEQQIKALAGDEALAKSMAQASEMMSLGAAHVATMMQATGHAAGATGNEDQTSDDDTGNTPGDTPRQGAGTQAVDAASGDPEHDPDELALRVAELEKRIDRLESLVEPSGKIPPRKG